MDFKLYRTIIIAWCQARTESAAAVVVVVVSGCDRSIVQRSNNQPVPHPTFHFLPSSPTHLYWLSVPFQGALHIEYADDDDDDDDGWVYYDINTPTLTPFQWRNPILKHEPCCAWMLLLPTTCYKSPSSPLVHPLYVVPACLPANSSPDGCIPLPTSVWLKVEVLTGSTGEREQYWALERSSHRHWLVGADEGIVCECLLKGWYATGAALNVLQTGRSSNVPLLLLCPYTSCRVVVAQLLWTYYVLFLIRVCELWTIWTTTTPLTHCPPPVLLHRYWNNTI